MSSQISPQDVMNALRVVKDPDLGRDIVTLGFIKELEVGDNRVSFTLQLTTPACPMREQLVAQARAAVMALGVANVQVRLAAQAHMAAGHRLRRAHGADRAGGRALRQLHQRRIVGPRNRSHGAMGDDVPDGIQ